MIEDAIIYCRNTVALVWYSSTARDCERSIKHCGQQLKQEKGASNKRQVAYIGDPGRGSLAHLVGTLRVLVSSGLVWKRMHVLSSQRFGKPHACPAASV